MSVTVQLYVLGPADDGRVQVISRFAPHLVRTEREADEIRFRLWRDNKWGDASRWPYVRVSPADTDPWPAGTVLDSKGL